MDKEQFEIHLKDCIIPFWNRLTDRDYGGFYGYVDENGNVDKCAVKGVILNSRILWFYSSAYELLKSEELLENANHAYQFMINHCYDSRYGGVFWSVNYDGSVNDDIKHTYNQAFAIYALSAYYKASGNKEALSMAYVLYHLIEDKCRDKYGYLEAFERNFIPASNEKLSENGVLAERTMNTLLHILEAYTELYRADNFEEVGESIRWVLDLFRDKIYNADKKICEVFFDKQYKPLIDLESFGHNIEASWLIDRAVEVLDDRTYTERMSGIIDGLAYSAYHNAYDIKEHALDNEREAAVVNKDRIWWVQAEAVTGFYNAHRRNHDNCYLEASQNIWKFILDKVYDKEHGEWFEIIRGGKPVHKPLVQPWKCPYHNGRMCIEMIRRIEGAEHAESSK